MAETPSQNCNKCGKERSHRPYKILEEKERKGDKLLQHIQEQIKQEQDKVQLADARSSSRFYGGAQNHDDIHTRRQLNALKTKHLRLQQMIALWKARADPIGTIQELTTKINEEAKQEAQQNALGQEIYSQHMRENPVQRWMESAGILPPPPPQEYYAVLRNAATHRENIERYTVEREILKELEAIQL
eukprot:g23562.t1